MFSGPYSLTLAKISQNIQGLKGLFFIQKVLMLYHFTSVTHLYILPFFFSLFYDLQDFSGFYGLFYTEQEKGHWCLFFSSLSCPAAVKRHAHTSSYFSMHQLVFESVPETESQCISRFSILLLVCEGLSFLNLARCPDMWKTSWVPSSQRSGQDPQAGPHCLTLSLDSTPKVPKHFFKPMPVELRYAKFCFDAVCFFNPDDFSSLCCFSSV